MNYLITIVSILGGVQGLFLTFSLLSLKKYRLRANKYLAAVVFILAVTLILAFLHFSRLILKVPHLYNITPLFTLLYGPLLYFYVLSLLRPDTTFSRWNLLHFLPVPVFIRLQWGFLNLLGETKSKYLMNVFEDQYLPRLNTTSNIRILHLAIYLGICFFIFFKAAKTMDRRSNGSYQPRLSWIQTLLISSVLIWGTYTFLYFYDQHWLNISVPIVITAALYVIGLYAIKFPELFRDVHLKGLGAKYEYSKLSEADKNRHRLQIQQLLENEKLFTKPDLKLQTLSEQLNIPAQNLSQIINESFSQNFSEFINSYRIKEAQRRLLDKQNRHLTIVAIANDVGFKSKSAFNTAFKKATGQTPSEFLKSSGVEG